MVEITGLKWIFFIFCWRNASKIGEIIHVLIGLQIIVVKLSRRLENYGAVVVLLCVKLNYQLRFLWSLLFERGWILFTKGVIFLFAKVFLVRFECFDHIWNIIDWIVDALSMSCFVKEIELSMKFSKTINIFTTLRCFFLTYNLRNILNCNLFVDAIDLLSLVGIDGRKR